MGEQVLPRGDFFGLRRSVGAKSYRRRLAASSDFHLSLEPAGTMGRQVQTEGRPGSTLPMPASLGRSTSWAVSPQKKHDLERYVIGAAALVFSALFLYMIADFLQNLFLAAVLALLLHGPKEELSKRLNGYDKLSACLIVVLAALAVVIPAALIIGLVVEQTGKAAALLAPTIQGQIKRVQSEGFVAEGFLAEWFPPSVRDEIIEYQAATLSQLSDLAGHATSILLKSLRASTGGGESHARMKMRAALVGRYLFYLVLHT